jgi:hypothetical protein
LYKIAIKNKNLSHKHIQMHKNKTRYFSGTSIFNIVPVLEYSTGIPVPVPAGNGTGKKREKMVPAGH